jgi:LmbE family N-acetylglucosaminyl deacetylase
MKILVIGAHYDDVEIGCGGMLLRKAAEGDKIIILSITNSGYTQPSDNFTRSADIAKREAEVAAEMIGAELICLEKPPLHLNHNEEFTYEFDRVIKSVKPDIVLTHWGGDFHSDHAAVSQSSIRAARNIGTILMYRSNWYTTESPFSGNYYVDISEYLEKKLEIIRVYKSVLEPVNYSWIDFIRRQNQYEGMKIGVEAAECFSCFKYVEW